MRATVGDGAFPVVLSGSCFLAAIGTVIGLGERSPGVVWFDAHADFNSPDTTIEGYLDGMGLAMLTGGAWHGMLGDVEGFSPLPETAVVLAGARDFDEPEKQRLDSSAVNWLPTDRLRATAPLLEAVDALEPQATGSTSTWTSTSSTPPSPP